MPDVVVLFSGGLDSTVAATKALLEGRLHSVLSIRYGAAHTVAESLAAARGATKHEVPRVVLDVYLDGVSAMITGSGVAGPRILPGRNLILIAHAVSYAAQRDLKEVWIGCNRDDADAYPDCSRLFLDGADSAAWWGARVNVRAPLIGSNKVEVVRAARRLGVDVDATWSCYEPTKEHPLDPCGTCNACALRTYALKLA